MARLRIENFDIEIDEEIMDEEIIEEKIVDEENIDKETIETSDNKEEYYYDGDGIKQKVEYFTDSRGIDRRVPFKRLEDIYDPRGNIIEPGENFVDARGYKVNYGEPYYSYVYGISYAHEPRTTWDGDAFFDGRGRYVQPGDNFYDKNGFRRDPENTNKYDFDYSNVPDLEPEPMDDFEDSCM